MGATVISRGGSGLGSGAFVNLRGDIHGSEDDDDDEEERT